jgi:hypothetical protein
MDEEQAAKGSLWKGLLVAAGVNFAALLVAVTTVAIGIGVILLVGFGLLQILWLLPFYLQYKRKGESNICKGILLGAGITVLLSATCFANLNLTGMH